MVVPPFLPHARRRSDALLSCALAAGLLALAGWRTRGSRGEALVDPACGDGFLVVEAASAVRPGSEPTRERWGFFGWVLRILTSGTSSSTRRTSGSNAASRRPRRRALRPAPRRHRPIRRMCASRASTSSPAIARARPRQARGLAPGRQHRACGRAER
ncbi:MAG: hypothetical protein ACLTMP_07980 [Eggerthella lenta]